MEQVKITRRGLTNEDKRVIANYKPHKGFYDLSKKPSTLTKPEYAAILKTQNGLVQQSEHAEYLKKYNRAQWDRLRGLSEEYQQIVFKHWRIEDI